MGISTTPGTYLLQKLHVLNSTQKFIPRHAVYAMEALSFIFSPCSNSPTHTTPLQQHIKILRICFPIQLTFPIAGFACPKAGFIQSIFTHLGDIDLQICAHAQIDRPPNFSTRALMARKSSPIFFTKIKVVKHLWWVFDSHALI